jgi:hypothetical protein
VGVEESLQIIAASYGLLDVTTKLISLVTEGKQDVARIDASNDNFGDGWHKTTKTLVVVYRYGSKGAPVTQIAQEDRTMVLEKTSYSAPQNYDYSYNADKELNILGAAYGLANVTEKVKGMIKNQQLAPFIANNTTFSDTIHGQNKSFVFVYRYRPDRIYLDIVQEGKSYSLKYRPPFSIISAYFADVDVTKQTQALVSKRSLSIDEVTFSTFDIGDPMHRVTKSFVVLYFYGGGGYQMKITAEGDICTIDYTETPVVPPQQFTNSLQVIKAAYGLTDVTSTLATYLKSNLSVPVTNDTFTETLKGQKKTFVAWYRAEDYVYPRQQWHRVFFEDRVRVYWL